MVAGIKAKRLISLLLIFIVSFSLPFPLISASPKGYVWAYTEGRTVSSGNSVSVYVRGYDINSATLDVYSFDAFKYFSDASNSMWSVSLESVKDEKRVKTFNVPVKKIGRSFDSMVSIESLEPGTYFAIVRSKDSAGDSECFWFTVGNLGLIAKQSKSKLLIYSVDLVTGSPISDVQIVCNSKDNEYNGGTTDNNGILEIALSDPNYNATVIGRLSSQVAVVYASSAWDSKKTTVYMYTDRPIYRPSQIVSFKGIARGYADNGYEVLSQDEVVAKIYDPRDNLISTITTVTNEHGSFDGSFSLGEEPMLGSYRITSEIQGEFHTASFSVQEYRKPEWAVTIKFDKNIYVNMEDIQADIQADYYFGAPVADAAVNYRVYRQEIGYISETKTSEWYDYTSYGYGNEYYYGSFVTSGTCTTDANGHAVVIWKAQSPASKNYKYILEVDVADVTNKSAFATSSVDVAQGMFDIRFTPFKYVVDINEPADFKIETSSLSKEPVAKELEINIYQRTWTRNGSKDTLYETKSVATSKKGTADFSVALNKSGTYLIVAKGIDERGNVVKAEEYLWVWSDGSYYSSEEEQSISIVLDKNEYNKGDVASAVITAPALCKTALLTIEGEDIKDARVIEFSQGNAKVELEITERYEPNVFVVITSVVNGNMVTAQAALNVNVQHRAMSIEVSSDKSKYAPGETATYTMRTYDSEGKPISCELSFALVDEAIFAIKSDDTQDIRNFFFGRRYNSVTTENSFPRFYYGGTSKDGASESVRKDFRDTAVWIPYITTDEDGFAKISVKLPDNLTTWRATVRGHSDNTVTGQTTFSTLVTKPLLCRLATPRFFTSKDESEIVGVVHNYSQRNRRVGVHLVAEGAEVLDGRSRYVDVPAGGSTSVTWKVKPTGNEKATFLMRCRAWFLTDALQIDVPVNPFGREESHVTSGELVFASQEASVEFDIPEGSLKGNTALTVNLSGGYEGVIANALNYLAAYPYGCVEQTMSSFLPDVVAKQASDILKLSKFEKVDELSKMVSSGLMRLYKFQHFDGGWGWWEYDDSTLWMTSYVLYGFKKADEAGFDISKDVMENGVRYLSNSLSSLYYLTNKGTNKFTNRTVSQEDLAFALYVLSMYTDLSVEMLGMLENIANRSDVSSKALAFIALASNNSGYYEIRDNAINSLKSCVNETQNAAFWSFDDKQYYWRSEISESTAWVIMALLSDEQVENYELASKAVNYIVNSRKGDVWRSTRESSACVMAIVEKVKASGVLESKDRKVDVIVNGTRLVSQGIKADDVEPYVIKVSNDILNTGKNTVEIIKTGEGALYYTINANWYMDTDEIEASTQYVDISRTYYVSDRTSKMLVDKDDKKRIESLVPLDLDNVKIGSEILVRVVIKTNSPLEYLAIEDPIPSGFEVVSETVDRYSWYYWYSRMDIRDDKVVFFADYLENKKEYVFEYYMSPENVGEFKVMPTKVWSMYYPEMESNGVSMSLKVAK